MVHTLVGLLGKRENIENYTVGDSNLVLLEVKDAEKIKLTELQAHEEVGEAILQGNHLTLSLKEKVKEVFIERLTSEEEVAETEGKSVVNKVMDTIQGIFAPILTPLAGAGILQGITIILTTTGIVPTGNAEEAILNSISGAVFYFMPILLAFSSAKVFKASPFLVRDRC